MTNNSNEHTESNTSDRPDWDSVWMAASNTIGSRSLCSRAKVGCVIVGPDQSVLSATYNGPPPGLEMSGPCSGWCERAKTGESTADYENCPSNHAEINAIARMAPVVGATAYVNRMCCMTCAKALAAARIGRVVCEKTEIDGHLNKDTVKYLESCGVSISFV